MKLQPIIATIASLVLCAGMLTANKAQAQDHEIGLLLGASNYVGDLEQSPVNPDELNFAFGGLYRYYMSPRFSLKAGVNYGHISGDDQNYPDDRDGYDFHFRSHVLEGSLQLEWNILPFVPRSDDYRFAPYLFAGVSVFNFNPEAQEDRDGDDWVELQPLGTEGQNLDAHDDGPYDLTQFSVPMGLGFKYNIAGKWNLGLEVGARMTFTDYLDDVGGEMPNIDNLDSDQAQHFADPAGNLAEGDLRGVENSGNDWYAFSGITISYTIRSYECNGDWD